MTNDSEPGGRPSTAPAASPRRRDAAATREAVLVAAREIFTRLGYDGAGIRDIARGAGVDARLIGRYFGSKEGLFAEVVEAVFEKTMMMGPGHNHEAARSLLADTVSGPADGILMVLRSAANERAVAIMRNNLELRYQRAVADGLPGANAVGRAALLVAVCSGVQHMRNVIRSTALTDGDLDDLVPYLEAALDALSTELPPASGSTTA